MPIPSKRKDEDSKKFVSRCMSDPVMKKDYKDSQQRVAVCLQESRATAMEGADLAYQFAVTVDGVHSGVEKIPTLTQAMHLTLEELKNAVSNTSAAITGNLVAPISPEIELWGAGVTYLRSRDARKEESGVPDVYQRVYEADRPELFFKSTAVRARGTGAAIGIRYDSAASVPEPEVALFINKHKEIIGYGICNDVTSRSIEGENPLYLSQAKIYVGSTSLGPDITPAWLAPSAAEMTIKAKILRGASTTWEAQTSLGQLNRTLEDLVDYLFRLPADVSYLSKETTAAGSKLKFHNKPKSRCEYRIRIIQIKGNCIAAIGIHRQAICCLKTCIVSISSESIERRCRTFRQVPVRYIQKQIEGNFFVVPFFINSDIAGMKCLKAFTIQSGIVKYACSQRYEIQPTGCFIIRGIRQSTLVPEFQPQLPVTGQFKA
jgi:2-dehydro-3-deoxy-D-arabinonate dehydratase